MLKEEFLLVSDLHIDEYSRFATVSPDGMNSRLFWTLDILTQIMEYGEKHNVKTLLVGGDIFHRRGVIPVAAYDAAWSKFAEFALQGWKVISIVGNHDQESKSGGVHALRPLPVELMETAGAIEMPGGTLLGCVPFCETPSRFLQELSRVARDSRPDCYLIHQGINNAKIAGDEILSRHETNLEDIRQIIGEQAFVFSGHYHIHQYVDPKFLYIGSATPMDFSDTTPKGFLHVRFRDKGVEIKQVESRAPKFITLTPEQIGKVKTEGHYVRVVYSGDEPKEIKELDAAGWVATKAAVQREYQTRSSIQPDQSPMVIFRQYLKDVKLEEDLTEEVLMEALDAITGGKSFEQSLGGHKIDVLDLQINNFMRFREQSLDFQNLSGLTLIEGENLDDPSATSNGAGKSTILEAVKWCMYGTTARGLSADEVVNSTVGKDCSVEMILALDGATLCRLRRYRKHSQHKNQFFFEMAGENEEWEDLRGKSDGETQEKMVKLLGIDEQTFDNTVFFGHGFTKSFAALSDKEQKAVLERLLGVEYFNVLLDAARARSKEWEEMLRSAEIRTSYLKNRLTEEQSSAASLAQEAERFEEEQRRKLELIESSLEEAEDFVKTVRDTKEEDKKIKELERRIQEVSKSDDPEIESLGKIKERMEYGHSQLLKTEKKHKALLEKLASLNRELEKNTTIIQMREKELAGFGQKNVCPTCYQEIPQDNQSVARKMAELETSMLEAQQKNNGALDFLAPLQQDISEAEEDLKKFTRVAQKARDKLLARSEESDKLRALEAEKHSLVRDRDKIQGSLGVRNAEISRLKEQREALKSVTNPVKAALQRANEKMQELKTELVELGSASASYFVGLKVSKFWEVAFSDKGAPVQPPIKSYLFDSIVPVLDELARQYSEILTSGSIEVQFNTVTALKSGELRDKFSVSVLNKHGAVDYRGDSGGERRKVDLAVMFALHSLARIRSGSVINILCLDEILDSLDAEGCERVMILLREMSKEIPIIFVITHNESLKTLFSSKITVRKKNGVSEIFDYASSEK